MAHRELPPLTNAVWLRRHALADGLNHQAITALVRSGEWYSVRRGAYTSGELWRSLGPEDRHRLRCRAVLLVSHPSTTLTHVSSAIEQGAETWGFDLDQVHTTRTDGKGGRNEAGVIRHEGVLLESDVVTVHGVRVTAAPRALAETCTIAGVEPALTVVNSLLHRDVVKPWEFDDQVLATRTWPRSLTADLVRRLAHPRIESVAETRAFHLFWKEHIPRPEPQVEVYDEGGRLVGRVDFAWLRHGVFAEMDGRLKYVAMRREGESLEDFLMREKRREELICALTGWVCIRITWEDLGRPALLARRIRRLLDARAARLA